MGESRSPGLIAAFCTLALLTAVSLATMACGTNPAADNPKTSYTTAPTTNASTAGPTIETTPSGAEIFFPKQRRLGDVAFPGALGHGKLIVDEKGCIRMKPLPKDPGFVPIWPSNYELEADSHKIQVLDNKGRVVAQVGKQVSMGGGEVGLQIPFVDQRTRRELRERCPGGGYWLVFPGEVRIPRQG